ncbi:MAG: AAA family ATPase [Candidatus Cloacimonetes bacterium]|nr:AAA family ATPase [Candidatus Cloacimonadota bacterium]
MDRFIQENNKISLEGVNPEDFKNWLMTYKSNRGVIYSEITVSNYVRAIITSPSKLAIYLSDEEKDPFLCTSSSELKALFEKYKEAPNYEEININNGNNAFSLGMEWLIRYYEYLNNSVLDTESDIHYVDFNNHYHFRTNRTKPVFIEYKKRHEKVDNWSALYVYFMKALHTDFTHKIEQLSGDKLRNTKRIDISDDSSNMSAPKKITEILFLETHLSTQQIIYKIKMFAEHCGLELNDIRIGYVYKNNDYVSLDDDELQPFDETLDELNTFEQKVSKKSYTKSDFLTDVYISEAEYNSLTSLLYHKKNIILQGAPGVGKTFTAKRLAYSIIGYKDESKVKLVQFHQNYSYEDFIMGYKPDGDGFELQTGIFYDFCMEADKDRDNDYFFIIDEINRGNLSKIFGELLMMIESDYRDENMTMAYDNRQFCVPENLYIIGMMNTADRSLAMIDYALRRRFSFYDMTPALDNERFKEYQSLFHSSMFDKIIETIKKMNKEISEDASLGAGFCIGHSYFCGQEEFTKEWLTRVIKYDIIPMIKEYWFDVPKKHEEWTDKLLEVLRSE